MSYTKDFIYSFKHRCIENPFKRPIEFSNVSIRKIVPSENAWKVQIPRTEYEVIIKKVRGILNKISINNFDSLSSDLFGLELNTEELVKDTIGIVVDKSINEPNFGDIYANLCLRLSKKDYNVDDTVFNFRNELVNQCQKKFESEDNLKKSIGNIKFIGELYNKDLLPNGVMLGCINLFLGNIHKNNNKEENIEKICKLLFTIGSKMEQFNIKIMDEVIKKIKPIYIDKSNSARYRFMVLDLVELRERGWVERIKKECSPKLAK